MDGESQPKVHARKRKTVAGTVLETTWRKTDDNKPKGKGVARRWKRVKLIGNGGKVTRKSGDKIKQEVERTEQKRWKASRGEKKMNLFNKNNHRDYPFNCPPPLLPLL